MIKFYQERLRKFTPETVWWLGHTLETRETQSLVCALQQAKQGLPEVFCIPGANGHSCQVLFSACSMWKVFHLLLPSWHGKALRFFLCFMVGKIQAKFCHWGLASFRRLGWRLLGDPTEEQSYWMLGGNRAAFSIIRFRKHSSKLNYVTAISSFKPSAGQVGAGPRSEQYLLWVMGWGKDRSALLQEIPGNAEAPLNMSTVWLHHRTCQKQPWLSNRVMQLSVQVLQRYPLIFASVRCLHIRILKRSLLNIVILTAFCPIRNILLTIVARCGENTAFNKDFCTNSYWKSAKFLWVNLKGTNSIC